MPDTIPVTIELAPDVAAALADPVTRERVARLVAAAVRPAPDAGSRDRTAGTNDLVARFRAGETPEGWSTREPVAQERVAAARALAAEFRDFRRGRTLGGLDPKALIREGLR